MHFSKKRDAEDKLIMTYVQLQQIWCRSCAAVVLDDNVDDHINTVKHKNHSTVAIKRCLHQTRMEPALLNSSQILSGVTTKNHYFRLDTTRTFIKFYLVLLLEIIIFV